MTRALLPAAGILAIHLLLQAAAPGQPVAHPAGNADPAPGPVGAKPYEMGDRPPPHPSLCDFADVTNWVVEGQHAEGWLYSSQDQRLYQDHCGKLVYVGQGKEPSLLVRPSTAREIPEPWDSITFWNYGNNWSWTPDTHTPPLQVAVVLSDATGRHFEIDLGRIDYTYWYMMHGRLNDAQRQYPRPMHLVGLRFSNAGNTEKRTVYLGPLSFYQAELPPLTFEAWPGRLPFPTREETILPANTARKFENRVRPDGAATAFVYSGEDGTLEYRYTAGDGTLGDIELRQAGSTIRPMAGGGFRLEVGGRLFAPGDAGVSHTLLAHRLDESGVLSIAWRLQVGNVAADVHYRLRIRQKSLIVDMEASQPIVERIELGRAEPLQEAKLFRFPYLTYGGGEDPRVLSANGLFLFSQFDWYVSDATRLEGRAAQGSDWAAFNGAAVYARKTDGTRNPVRERLFLTASPNVQEVLPTIPNPPSPFGAIQGERAWRVRSGADHAAEIADATRFRQLGCDKVSVRYHEDSWRDAGESFTFRLQAAPGRGGDAALKKFVQAIQALGWRVGLYTNYIDFAPVNSFWDPDHVVRLPDGNWRRAWTRCYSAKPLWAVEMEARLAPQIQAKFGENHSYCDVMTCLSPFDVVDYDARVPGAATFRKTFECYGRLLYNEKTAHHGPVYSEGTNHWWYAGLVDGNYGQIRSPAPWQEPLLVDFDLLKMHPLEMDAGMGDPSMFFRDRPPNNDQFIATTLAYGHLAFLAWDPVGSMKMYYMVQPVQKRYAMIPVERIEYEDGGKMVSTSQALRSGAHLRDRVHIVYENGTEVYVNGNPEPWTIPAPQAPLELPQWGYAAWRRADGLMAWSAHVASSESQRNGAADRSDFCQDAEQCYADSRGSFVFMGPLAIEGAAALKKDGNDWWIIPAGQLVDFAFEPRLIGAAGRQLQFIGVAEDGTPGDPAELRWSRGLVHALPGRQSAFKYRVVLPAGKAPGVVTCESRQAIAGEPVHLTLPAGQEVTDGFWEMAGQKRPAELQKVGGGLVVRVPTDVSPGTHVWLGLRAGEGMLWVDFISAEPVRVSLAIDDGGGLKKGEPLRATLQMSNHLDREANIPWKMAITGGAACRPDAVKLSAWPHQAASGQLEIALPWQAGAFDISAVGVLDDRSIRISRSLTCELTTPVIVDLLTPPRPPARGFRRRGGDEVAGMPTVEDGTFDVSSGTSGGVERRCLFSHPPFGASGVGYAFAVYDLQLPADPAVLEFAMGLRDGLDRSDGVTYKVIAIDSTGKEAELLATHWKQLRWESVQVALGAYAGQRVRLKLIADCGPQNDSTADHALWAEPRILLAEPRLCVKAGMKDAVDTHP